MSPSAKRCQVPKTNKPLKNEALRCLKGKWFLLQYAFPGEGRAPDAPNTLDQTRHLYRGAHEISEKRVWVKGF